MSLTEVPAGAEGLRRLPGFGRLSTRLIDKLARAIAVEQVTAKTVLIHEGETPEVLLVLLDGMLQQFSTRGTHETTFVIMAAPVLVQPHALYGTVAATASIRAVRLSRVGRIAMSYARGLLVEEPEFAGAIVDQIVAELEGLFGEFKSARTRNGLQRLAAWIVAMHRRPGVGAQITLPYDKAVLAARLGVAPATLSRDFAELERYGVKVCGRVLTVGDPERLLQIAAVDPLNMPPVP